MTDYDYQRDWRKSKPRQPLLEARSVLAIADGLTSEPPRPYAYDCSRGLTSAEYDRCVNWSARRMFGRNLIRMASEEIA